MSNKNPVEIENRKLEILSEKSRYILEKQIEEIRYMGSKAGTIVGIGAIFFPLIIYIFDKLEKLDVNNILLIISLFSFILGVVLLTFVLVASKTYTGYKETELDRLSNETIKEIHTYEIRGNKGAIKENQKKLKWLKPLYNASTWMTNISIIIISILLITSIFNNNQDDIMKKNKKIDKKTKIDKKSKDSNDINVGDMSGIFIPLDKKNLTAIKNVVVSENDSIQEEE